MGWFGKKSASKDAGLNSERYKGKPLLLVLENYVLDCIGVLPSDKVTTITQIVQRVFGGGDDWKATVRATLHLEDSVDNNLRQLWERNQQMARDANKVLSPEDFARIIVDDN